MTKDKDNDKSARDTHYATLRRAHRDARRERGEIPTPDSRKRAGQKDWKPPALEANQVFLYGLHTVRAALANPQRKNVRLSVTQNALARLEVEPETLGIPVDIVSPHEIERILGPEAIHQGVMLETRPLPVRRLEALKDSPLILVLDQVTDPHNVGALEMIPYIQITNLADALAELHDLGFQTLGLDSEGPAVLEDSFSGDKVALVLGSEGKGLRQKTRETVSTLARLDMPGQIKSLNVSNAAAIALYATRAYLKR